MPFRIIRNDITKVRADAIVNTANPDPVYGRGTDSAIYKAAGERELLAERKKIGNLKEGEVAVTPAFRLKAKYIIHTSGPVWYDGDHGEYELLASCYRKSLQLARHLGCKSIAFPLISTGSYGFPRDKALDIALDQISAFLEDEEMDITLVVFDRKTFNLSSELIKDVAQFIDENYVKGRLFEEYGQELADGRRRGQKEQDRRGLFSRINARRPGKGTPPPKADREYGQASPRRPLGEKETIVPGMDAAVPPEMSTAFLEESPEEYTVSFSDSSVAETPGEDAFLLMQSGEPESKNLERSDLESGYLESGEPESRDLERKDLKSGEPESKNLERRDLESGYLESGEPESRDLESGEPERKDLWSGAQASKAAPSGSAAPAGKKRKELRIERPSAGHRRSLQDVISQVGESFQECLLRTIDEKGLTDTQVYKRANIDRKLFSKIRCNPDYSPSRRTVVALVIALELNMDEAVDMLRKAGMAFSPGSKFDLIIAYCIQNKIYDIIRINALLFDYDQPLLGA